MEHFMVNATYVRTASGFEFDMPGLEYYRYATHQPQTAPREWQMLFYLASLKWLIRVDLFKRFFSVAKMYFF